MIRREEGYHTHHIGKYKNGDQFMAFVVGVPSKRAPSPSRPLKWYAVLHRFNPDGTHLETESLFLGTKAWGKEVQKPDSKLREMILRHGSVTYCDVEVRLFSMRIDGHRFGLVDASIPKEQYRRVDLVPNGLAFFPPWEGFYDT